MVKSELLVDWQELHKGASEEFLKDTVLAKAWEKGEDGILSFVLLLLCS